jgi:CBS domain-containing protein
VLGYLAWINVALGVFNLLPGYPLDGGRVLRALLWRWKGSLQEATRLASGAGKVLALGLLVLGAVQIFSGALVGGLWLILIGMFLHAMAEAGYRSTLLRASLQGAKVRDAMIREPVCVSPRISLADLVEDYVIARGHRAFPVVDEGQVRGLIGIEAVREVPTEARHEATVGEHLIPLDDAVRIEPDRPLEDAIERLQSGDTQRFLVLEGGRLRGLLTPAAVLRFLEVRGAEA